MARRAAGQPSAGAPGSPERTEASAAACLRASFLACFCSRRSRTALSRLIFAIVVFFLELDAMRVGSFPWIQSCRLAPPWSSFRRTCAAIGRVGSRGARLPRASGGLDGLDLRRVRALGPGLRVVADLRALAERLEAVARDAGVVHEEVLALIVRGDEAEPLLVAEPLHGSGCHLSLPGVCVRAERKRSREQQQRNARHEFGQASRLTNYLG